MENNKKMRNVISLVVFRNLSLAQPLIDEVLNYDFIDLTVITVVKGERENIDLHDRLQLNETRENLGYAKGHNQNFNIVKNRYPNMNFRFIVLNNDIKIITGFQKFVTTSRAGLISAPVISLGNNKFGFGRRFDNVFGRNTWHYLPQENIDWVSGCAFAISAKDFDKAKFDEEFFMYAEDLDLCLSLRGTVKYEICKHAVIEHLSNNVMTESTKKCLYRSILAFRNNRKIAQKYSKLRLLYLCWNLLRFLKNILILSSRDPAIILTIFRIYAAKFDNQEVVEFVHDQ